jgi:hypothetical protein
MASGLIREVMEASVAGQKRGIFRRPKIYTNDRAHQELPQEDQEYTEGSWRGSVPIQTEIPSRKFDINLFQGCCCSS